MPDNKNSVDEVQTLADLGLKNLDNAFWDLPAPYLYEHIIRNREGVLDHHGALIVRTGHFTGRSVKDKFIVDDVASGDKLCWGGFNRGFPEAKFDALYERVLRYLEGQQIYVEDCLVGAGSRYKKPLRVITQDAWHALFVRTMFVSSVDIGRENAAGNPEFTVIHVPHFQAMPGVDGTHSEAFVILHLTRRIALIGGTAYAGEIKKSIFAIMNFLLSDEDVLPVHASANVGVDGDTAIFFGPCGTGKTTLSSDPDRKLLGDDELGWSQHDVFNFEGGCYARLEHLSREKEPLIYAATERFGSILENVGIDMVTRRVDFDDTGLSKNTRAVYPVQAISNAIPPGVATAPEHIVILTSDAFGVLPAISKLTPEQVMYYFLLGYTARVAGSEDDSTEPEPQATFSPCFGSPVMARHPSVYASMLGDRVREGNVSCWLLNTGWSGGGYGVGERMDIDLTRMLLTAALTGQLDKIKFQRHPIFGLMMPETLDPIATWDDPKAYVNAASTLAEHFRKAFEQFETEVPPQVLQAGPL